MGKIFNVSADCKPNLHYMVNIESRIKEIKAMVDAGEYFTINRARQYGKTTTLRALSQFLKNDYIVASLDFQKMGDSKFKNENVFSIAFAKSFIKAIEVGNDISPNDLLPLKKALQEEKKKSNYWNYLNI